MFTPATRLCSLLGLGLLGLLLSPQTASAAAKTKAAVSQQFIKLDTNLDGVLSLDEFYKKQKGPKGDILFQQVDRNKDRILSLDEFLTHFVKK